MHLRNVDDFHCFCQTAAKKVNLADIGIVGGLGDGSDEKAMPSWTMGTTSGRNGYPAIYTSRWHRELSKLQQASIWLQVSLELSYRKISIIRSFLLCRPAPPSIYGY